MPTTRQLLWPIAVEHDGYVTAADAVALGLPDTALRLLAHRGKLAREARGVYRFDELPRERSAAYRFATLWTGRGNVALSHDTALDLYDLCDINPDRYHVTVPKDDRVRRTGGVNIDVHHEDLTADEIGWWEGIPCVTISTAIRQGIDTGVPTYLVTQALETARARGAITEAERVQLAERMGNRGRPVR